MADVAGLALSAIGLSSSFNLCVKALDTVHIATSHTEDFSSLNIRFENQRIRLIAWGRLVEQQCSSVIYDRNLDHSSIQAMERTLQQIKKLFIVTENLTSKHTLCGLEPSQAHMVHLRPNGEPIDPESREPRNSKAGTGLLPISSRIWQTIQWITTDRNRFTSLIKDLHDLIEDLEMLSTRCLPGMVDHRWNHTYASKPDNRAERTRTTQRRKSESMNPAQHLRINGMDRSHLGHPIFLSEPSHPLPTDSSVLSPITKLETANQGLSQDAAPRSNEDGRRPFARYANANIQ